MTSASPQKPPSEPDQHHQSDHDDRRPERRGSRLLRVLVPLAAAALVTTGVVGAALATAPSSADLASASSEAGATVHPRPTTPLTVSVPTPDADVLKDRSREISRSASRTQVADAVTLQRRPTVEDHEFTTTRLNVWDGPREKGPRYRILPARAKVAVSEKVVGHWAQILIEGRVRWVNNTYLVEHRPPKPTPRVAAGPTPTRSAPAPRAGSRSGHRARASHPQRSASSTPAPTTSASGACPSGSAVESGIVPAAITVHRVICANFPQISTYGGYRPDGEHADGHALDVMVGGDSGSGQAVADFLVSNASSLGVDHVIWSQRIWSHQRSAEGWRSMPDRGSPTANHYDHVHVRVY